MKPRSSALFSSTIRTDGRPSGVAVASAIWSPSHPFVEELERVSSLRGLLREHRAASGSATGAGTASRDSAPTVAIQRVGRRPIAVPSTPAIAVPTGRTP